MKKALKPIINYSLGKMLRPSINFFHIFPIHIGVLFNSRLLNENF